MRSVVSRLRSTASWLVVVNSSVPSAPLMLARAVAHRDVENGHGRGKVVLMVYSTFDHAP
ncbi:hypothetical protein ACFOLC_11865 [Lysobacter cavernae]|uniref:Uncharacterized protein n=1 Tax=Lysobacter cavernae TaxID=1685901 RepID=A0ABV7RUM5_9GAMM